MDYRHEIKHEINQADLLVLRQRLRAVMRPDPHAVGGRYTVPVHSVTSNMQKSIKNCLRQGDFCTLESLSYGLCSTCTDLCEQQRYMVRSLYFDNASDKALREKLDGISRREKFRIRYYNGDTSLIHLEKKSRVGGLGKKQSALLTAAQVQSIVEGDLDWMPESAQELIRELYVKMRTGGLGPKIIVEYLREPFTFDPGNVRVTLDYNIRTGTCCSDFLEPDCATIPAGDAPMILEVKWDAFLPDMIRDAVRLPGRRASAFSKYAQCRIYG